MSEQHEPPVPESLQELRQKAGAPDGRHDVLDALRAHCEAVIDALGESHAVTMARSKLQEMIFWLRAHQNRNGRV